MNFTDKFLKSCLAAKGLDINSINQAIALRLISLAKGGITMSYIGNLLDVSSSAITGMIDRFEKMGLVMRQLAPHDRRTIRIVITERGREHVKIIIGEP